MSFLYNINTISVVSMVKIQTMDLMVKNVCFLPRDHK
jgi:hypothetical protein